MRLKLNYIFLSLSLLALPGCKENEALVEPPIDIPDSEKTPIELSVGVVDGGFNSMTTRAVITDGASKTKRAFEKATNLFFIVKAEDGNTTSGHTPGAVKWGYNYATAAAATDAQKESGVIKADTKSNVSFNNNYLYWDDAYARDTKVSIYSIAVANYERTENISIGTSGTTNSGSFGSATPAKIDFTTTEKDLKTTWSIGYAKSESEVNEGYQNSTSFSQQDLVFSNNHANYNSAEVTNKDFRLKFNTDANNAETYHKFDKGELIYYHALTKFTIKIKAGDGFTATSTSNDFKFTDANGTACTTPNNSFCINGFYGNQCKFDIATGEFYGLEDSNKRNYTSINLENTTYRTADVGEYYTLTAFVVPGTDMTDASGPSNAFSFVIDGNKYDISLSQLYTALKNGKTNGTTNVLASILDDSKKLKAGYNYEFTFTVSKTKISGLTAQVVDWENVTAENITPSNARIKLQLEERGTAKNSDVDFYRAKDPDNITITDDYEGYKWETGYTNNGNKAKASFETDKWVATNWYWPDNTTFYHFRALSPTSQTVTSATNDYITISSGTSYTDVLWGAPFKDIDASAKFTYSTSQGFDGKGADQTTPTHQIYHGIGPTEDVIKLLMFHMMSEVQFVITSNSTVDDEKINLGTGQVKINFEQIYTEGKVYLGNGLVEPTGSPTTYGSDFSVDSSKLVFGAIPQALDQENSNVILVITTPDNNRYKVTLKDITVPTNKITSNNLAIPYSTDESGNYIINRWYPGYKYTYNINLKKKGIDKITATILQWETVEATPGDVQIK